VIEMAVPREKHPGGRPRLYTSKEEVEGLIQDYFNECEAKDKPKTMQGLANALGMSRETLCQYSRQEEFADAIRKARQQVVSEIEEKLLKSGQPTIGCIFWLKNNAGWVDKQEIESTSRVSLSVPDDVEDTGDKAE
jgi:hypothetical protein